MAVFNDQTDFVNATGAIVVPVPDSDTAFPNTSCGVNEPTGGILNSTAQVQIGFDSNNLTVTQSIQGTPPNDARGLCIFDPGFMPNPNNTNPNVFDKSVIVANGEDDYLIVFNTPVRAVGFRLLTNNCANEVVTLTDASTQIISVENINADTSTNVRQFIGFVSQTPIKSLLLDTCGGASQNEGIDEFKIAQPLFLIIDEDTIDNGISSIELISFGPPGCGGGDPSVCVNDDNADPGVRDILFSDIIPFSGLVLPTGQVDDEGLFQFTNPDPQKGEDGDDFTIQEFISATGAAKDENNLDKIDGVFPLGAADILALEGKTVCAVVYDSDVSADVKDRYASLKGATLGLTAFKVTAVGPDPGGSVLPEITVDLLSQDELELTCAGVVPPPPDGCPVFPVPIPDQSNCECPDGHFRCEFTPFCVPDNDPNSCTD